MARDLTAGTLAELGAARVRPAFFVEMEVSTGFVRFWSGVGDLTWDARVWTGAGDLLQIAPAAETTEIAAKGISVTLTGIKASFLATILANLRQSKLLKCYIGFLNSNEVVIVDPYLFFSGKVDEATITEEAQVATVTVQAESRLVDLRRVRIRRYTSEDQKIDFPQDEGFSFVPFIQNWTGQWGTAPPFNEQLHAHRHPQQPDDFIAGDGFGDGDSGGDPGSGDGPGQGEGDW